MLRRRAMMAQASGAGPSPVECPYITDGLIFWLDGINRGGVAGQWTDLIGGKTFTLYNVTENEDCVTFSNQGYGICNGAISSNWETETLEFAVKSIGITSRCFLCQPNTSPSGIGFITQNSGYQFNININGERQAIWNANSGVRMLSANNSFAVINGTQKTKKTSTDSWAGNQTNNTYLCCRMTTSMSRYFGGTVHSVRIYNRHLSVEEMQANQAVDAARFNL